MRVEWHSQQGGTNTAISFVIFGISLVALELYFIHSSMKKIFTECQLYAKHSISHWGYHNMKLII